MSGAGTTTTSVPAARRALTARGQVGGRGVDGHEPGQVVRADDDDGEVGAQRLGPADLCAQVGGHRARDGHHVQVDVEPVVR